MLIAPVVERLNWTRPPAVTIALILLNCLIFFLYQSGDRAREQNVVEAYFTSPLPSIELPLYAAHLRATNPTRYADLAQESGRQRLLLSMESDQDFMWDLRAERIVTPEHPRHGQWQAERARIDALESKLSYRRFGLTPAEPQLATLVISTFLHVDLLHLAGDMIFLLIVGAAVEGVLGPHWFVLLYFLGGLAGNVLTLVAQPQSVVPSVGAAGAIAGLMGLFAVVFGPRRVNFLYGLPFVVGIRAMRGIVLLPIWIGWQALLYAIDRGSEVNYMPHVGGLIGGALVALLVTKRLGAGPVGAAHQRRGQEASDQAEYERARALAADLDFKSASAVFARLADRFPHEVELLKQWYAVAKTDPDSDDYHRVVSRILALPKAGATLLELQRPVFTEYFGRSQGTSNVEPRALANIGLIFAQAGDIGAAERAADALFKQAPGDPQLAPLWDALARALAQAPGDAASLAKAKRYRALISAQAKVLATARLA